MFSRIIILVIFSITNGQSRDEIFSCNFDYLIANEFIFTNYRYIGIVNFRNAFTDITSISKKKIVIQS